MALSEQMNPSRKTLIRRPMLAETLPGADRIQRWPVLCSPKLDGVRCVLQDGAILSRSMKPIRNRAVQQSELVGMTTYGIDGELICEDQQGRVLPFNDIQSAVMSADTRFDETTQISFAFCAFDRFDRGLDMPFEDRLRALALVATNVPCFRIVPHRYVHDVDELIAYEEEQLDLGYEGIMIRDPKGPYKEGRSTLQQGWLLKLKRFEDSEAVVIGFEELLTNNNAPITNQLGLTERSHHQANLAPADTLGTLLVRDLKTGVEFGIGTGFEQKTRKAIWNDRERTLGRVVNYQHFSRGAKDKPRFPSFRGFRDLDDL